MQPISLVAKNRAHHNNFCIFLKASQAHHLQNPIKCGGSGFFP